MTLTVMVRGADPHTVGHQVGSDVGEHFLVVQAAMQDTVAATEDNDLSES